MTFIPLQNSSLFAIIDDDDFDLVMVREKYPYQKSSTRRWFLKTDDVGRNYAVSNTRREIDRWTPTRMHRLILGLQNNGKSFVDHINGNGLDNRRKNLRACTYAENSYNQIRKRPNCSSEYKGVSWSKASGKWRAHIVKDYKQLHLGLFETETEAALAYDLAAQQLFGEYACPNFISIK